MDDFNRVDQHAQKKLSVADRAMFSEVWAIEIEANVNPLSRNSNGLVWTRYEEAFAQSVTELQRPNMYLSGFMAMTTRKAAEIESGGGKETSLCV